MFKTLPKLTNIAKNADTVQVSSVDMKCLTKAVSLGAPRDGGPRNSDSAWWGKKYKSLMSIMSMFTLIFIWMYVDVDIHVDMDIYVDVDIFVYADQVRSI